MVSIRPPFANYLSVFFAMKNTLFPNINNDEQHSAAQLSQHINTDHNSKAYTHTLTVIGQAITPYLLDGVLNKIKDVFYRNAISYNYGP